VKTNELTITRAVQSELQAIQALVQRAYRGEAASASWSHEGELPTGERVTCDALSALIGSTTSTLFVGKLAGRLIGTSLIEQDGPDRCKIGLLSVDPFLQGQGIGNKLLLNAEHEARDRFGAGSACIEVLDYKQRLIAYYGRRGYHGTGLGRPYPHLLGVELLILRKQLQGGDPISALAPLA